MSKKLFFRIFALIIFITFLAGCNGIFTQPMVEPGSTGVLPIELPTSSTPITLNLTGDWEGKAEWPGLTFGISFSIAEGSNEVIDLKISLTCPGSTAPDGNYTFPSSMINDNTFSAFGTEGKFVSSTEAEGTFNGGISITCGQEVVPTEGAWTATRIAK